MPFALGRHRRQPPRTRLARHARRQVQGGPSLVDGLPIGRAEISLSVEAGAETPVRVEGQERPPSPVARDANCPLLDGSGESEISPWSWRSGETVPRRSEVRYRMPPDNRLARRAPSARGEPSDFAGGSAGDGKSPRQGLSGMTTHTLCCPLLPFLPYYHA